MWHDHITHSVKETRQLKEREEEERVWKKFEKMGEEVSIIGYREVVFIKLVGLEPSTNYAQPLFLPCQIAPIKMH